ncbi:hypothetical protein [Endozoicomonas sp. ONNA2]|uniref:hypothetical protein n=1 Tax=Endozoicomonas sp. ONNA2 TaxID=2828741 RepID=UPI002148E857|nr:hypothetical protein [Endozoicomonas sp. ONNA2]
MNSVQFKLSINTDPVPSPKEAGFPEIAKFVSRHVRAVNSVRKTSVCPDENIQLLEIMSFQAQITLSNQLQHRFIEVRPYLQIRFFPRRLFKFDESIQRKFEINKGQSHPRNPCALCNNDSRLLNTRFKGLTIISNFRPYSSVCWLIKPTEHLDQSKIFEKSAELFDLAKGMGSAYTFAHSSLRGNSQKHLHIHAMQEHLPLRKALADGHLFVDESLPVVQYGKTTVRWMTGDQANNTAHLSGIHSTGENRAEFEQVFNNILKYLSNSDVCGTGGYNLIYWVDDNLCLHSFIFPRIQNANVNPEYVPEKQGYGILEMCGLLIMAPVDEKTVGNLAAREFDSIQTKPYEEFVFRARNELTRLTPEQWQALGSSLSLSIND